MSNPVVIGQYWPAASFVHRMDPRMKMLLSLAMMVVVFCAQSWTGLAVCAAFIAAFCLVAEIPFGRALRSVAPLLPLVALAALANLFFVSEEGLASACFIGVRLFLLLLCMSLLTLTTTTLDITEAFERLLAPFARIGLPAHELGMIMGIALRFLPQFFTELRITYRAQVSRGATIIVNPFKGGLKSLSSLLIPLFTSAFRHAETLSAGMEARCYHGGNGRTRLHPLAFTWRDAIGCAAVALMLACVLAVNVLP